MISNIKMKVEPLGESTDPLVNFFTTNSDEMLKIIEEYRNRKLAEDIEVLEKEGGLTSIEDKLRTSFKTGLSDSDDHTERIKAFGENKLPKPLKKTYFEIS